MALLSSSTNLTFTHPIFLTDPLCVRQKMCPWLYGRQYNYHWAFRIFWHPLFSQLSSSGWSSSSVTWRAQRFLTPHTSYSHHFSMAAYTFSPLGWMLTCFPQNNGAGENCGDHLIPTFIGPLASTSLIPVPHPVLSDGLSHLHVCVSPSVGSLPYLHEIWRLAQSSVPNRDAFVL